MPPPPSLPGSVLVVAVDRLPAWIVSAYGATWVGQPTVAGLAARGVVFDRVIATTDDPRRTLADIVSPLAAIGCVAVVTDAEADLPGLTAPDVRRVPTRADDRLATDAETTNLGRLFASAEGLLQKPPAGGAGRPQAGRLVVIEATSLGVAWDAPPEFREVFQAPDDPPPPPGGSLPQFVADADTDPDLLVGLRHVFAGQLTLLDRALGRLLEAAGPATMVLMVGLRGLGLGLHGRVGPGPMPPYAELVHLPAILVDAGGRMAGQRHAGLVTPADLGATLAELAGLPPVAADGPPAVADPRRGISLAGLFDDWRPPHRDRVIVMGSGGAAIATAGWHAVLNVGQDPAVPRLHAKPDDFFELCDVADRSPDVARELGRLLETALAGREREAWEAPLSPEASVGVT
jgi:arylsulfatase A-like enzyme